MGRNKHLTREEVLRAYARAVNRRTVESLEPLLAEGFHYASQMVLDEIESKEEFLEYLAGKLRTIERAGQPVWAEMGELRIEFPGPCVIVAQGTKDNLVGVVLAEVDGERIRRLDMCVVPSPHSAIRSGEYPD